MRIADLIIKKRNGKELSDEEIHYFIDNLVDGSIEGSQLGNRFKFWQSIFMLRMPYQFGKSAILK